MSLFSADTRPAVARLLIEGYRRMTPIEKLKRACDLSQATRQMAASRIRRMYPDAGDRQIRLRVASLTLGRETMVRVFGWDPDKEGW
jgi:Rv0078B-related antitoxin